MSRLRTKQRRARRRRRVGYRIVEIMRLLARPGAVEWVLRFADALALRGMVADLFELREMLTDDLELLGFGKDDTGAWRVWHVEYPDEGSIPLVETVPAEEPAP